MRICRPPGKRPILFRIPFFIVSIGLLLWSSTSSALVLDVPERFQEQNQWCWAGVSQSIFNYYGTSITQTTIANYGTSGYNTWNYLYGSDSVAPYYRQGINMILDNWGLSNTYGAYTMSLVQVQSRIDARQPFVIRWGWYSGGGHFLTGRGYSGSNIYYMDPWPGNGYQIAAYSWVVDDGNHAWTHSLECTANPPATVTPPPAASPTPSALPATPSPAPVTPTPSVPPVTPTAAPATPTPGPTAVYLIIDADDYNGDGTPDIGIFRAASHLWAINGLDNVSYGTTGDIPVPGDYNGDGTADYGIWRPSTGKWWIKDVYAGGINADKYWGRAGDIPVPADYDGDFYTDTAVFRQGVWYLKGQTPGKVYYGKPGDVPVPGDYDGDGSADLAVFRPSLLDPRFSGGRWYIREVTKVFFGVAGDLAVPGDYNGDGTTQISVFRPSSGRWYIDGEGYVTFGLSGDIPRALDYDGDGTADRTIFRPSTGAWTIYGVTTVYYGTAGDQPVSGTSR